LAGVEEGRSAATRCRSRRGGAQGERVEPELSEKKKKQRGEARSPWARSPIPERRNGGDVNTSHYETKGKEKKKKRNTGANFRPTNEDQGQKNKNCDKLRFTSSRAKKGSLLQPSQGGEEKEGTADTVSCTTSCHGYGNKQKRRRGPARGDQKKKKRHRANP